MNRLTPVILTLAGLVLLAPAAYADDAQELYASQPSDASTQPYTYNERCADGLVEVHVTALDDRTFRVIIGDATHFGGPAEPVLAFVDPGTPVEVEGYRTYTAGDVDAFNCDDSADDTNTCLLPEGCPGSETRPPMEPEPQPIELDENDTPEAGEAECPAGTEMTAAGCSTVDEREQMIRDLDEHVIDCAAGPDPSSDEWENAADGWRDWREDNCPDDVELGPAAVLEKTEGASEGRSTTTKGDVPGQAIAAKEDVPESRGELPETGGSMWLALLGSLLVGSGLWTLRRTT